MNDQTTIILLLIIILILGFVALAGFRVNKNFARDRALLIREHNRICITMASVVDGKPREEVKELLSAFDLDSLDAVRTILAFTVIASQEYLTENGL
jgi:hypothetical protein